MYYPCSTGSEKAPLLFFVYGGGYVSGAKVLDPPNELKHKNIGAFFAKQGYVTGVWLPYYRSILTSYLLGLSL